MKHFYFFLMIFLSYQLVFSEPTEKLSEKGIILGNSSQVKTINTYSLKNGDIRHSYTYDETGKYLSELIETFYDGAWQNTTLYTYTYANDKQMSYLEESWVGNQWVKTKRRVYEYNQQGEMLSETDENWVSDKWVPQRRTLYYYEQNKKIYVDEVYSSDQWEKNYRKTEIFDDDGFHIGYLSEKWDGNDWVPDYRNTYILDMNKNIVQSIFEKWQDNKWVNMYKDISTYDDKGNVTSIINQNWENEEWVDKFKGFYTYDDEGNELSYQSQYWNGEDWENSYRYNCTYTSFGEILEKIEQLWNVDIWENYNKQSYTYNQDNYLSSILNEGWESDAWVYKDNYYISFLTPTCKYYSFSNVYKIEIFYYEPTAIAEESTILNSLSINPNPASNFIRINYSLSEPSSVSISLINSLGEESLLFMKNVFQEQGNYNYTFKTDYLSAGVYYLTISEGKTSITKKVIILK